MYKNGKYYLLLSVRLCLMYVYLCVMRLTLEEGLTTYSPPALFFFSSFFKVEISSRTPIPPFQQGSVHSGLADWDDCGWVFS